MLVGLKPEPLEINIVSKFVKDHFKNMTIKNLVKAFELNSSGKYWETVEPYGVLDTIFVGKILKFYAEEKRKYNIRKKQNPKQLSLSDGNPVTDEIAKEWLQKIRKELASNEKKIPQEEIKSDGIKRNSLQEDIKEFTDLLPNMSKTDLNSLLHNCKKSVTFGLDGTEYNPYSELINRIKNEIKNRNE
tara:strand:- start:52 stop:615 length:564 start_codon:yes stop_codon:yes gene_type:complete